MDLTTHANRSLQNAPAADWGRVPLEILRGLHDNLKAAIVAVKREGSGGPLVITLAGVGLARPSPGYLPAKQWPPRVDSLHEELYFLSGQFQDNSGTTLFGYSIRSIFVRLREQL